jgi:23S rRNA-/tRNA-specific pseudouridylate synthase
METEAALIPRKLGDVLTETREPPLPDNYRIPVVYQDDEICIVDKPYDIRVDGQFPTTVEKLVADRDDIRMDKFRLCNQLDYSTSGLLVLGLSKLGARNCNKLFSERKSEKWYIAIGAGRLVPSNPLLTPIRITQKILEVPNDFRMMIDNEKGLPAESIAVPIVTGVTKSGHEGTLFLVKILTGRRHQIRLHLRHLGHPILGDATYGQRDDNLYRMMLHAWKLILPYPRKPSVEVKSDIPPEFLEAFGSDSDSLLDQLDSVSIDM